MDLRRIIPSDITASAIAHLSLLTLLLLFSDVHPFGAVTAEQIPVEIVTPQDIAEKQLASRVRRTSGCREQAGTDANAAAGFLPARQACCGERTSAVSATSHGRAAAEAGCPGHSDRGSAASGGSAQSTGGGTWPTSRPSPICRSNTRCCSGLPPDLSPTLPPAPAQGRDKTDDNFDAPATEAADIANNLVAEFRRHLKTCSKLPASLTSADDVKVKLRVLMTPEGRLAAEPILIEASASMKGPLLMQGAIRALSACQPYAMLPTDRYGEWKVLDLSFTPRDFSAS